MLGICLAGGYGKRLSPWTLNNNKHLAPIYSEKDGAVPMIHYPIKTLKNSGINEILIISSREHSGNIIEHMGDGEDFGVNLSYKVQEMDRSPTGIAQALKLAEHFVGDENFAVILGDNFYEDTFRKEAENFDNTCKEYNLSNQAAIFLKEVNDSERFGVATISKETNKVIEIEEKPLRPKSNLAVTGFYFYTPQVFEILPTLSASARGELEITDLNNWYVKNNSMSSYILNGFWHDMGTPVSMLHTQQFINNKE